MKECEHCGDLCSEDVRPCPFSGLFLCEECRAPDDIADRLTKPLTEEQKKFYEGFTPWTRTEKKR